MTKIGQKAPWNHAAAGFVLSLMVASVGAVWTLSARLAQVDHNDNRELDQLHTDVAELRRLITNCRKD